MGAQTLYNDLTVTGSLTASGATIYNTLSVSDVIYDRAGNSNNWNNVYSSVASTSANWNNVYNSVAATSGNWNNVYSSVASTSANWNNTYTSVSPNSANWNNVYSSVAATSGSWNTVYSTVCALSTSWEESAEIIPTVTNYLSTNNVLLSSATITSGLQVNSNVLIYGNLSATGTSNFANTIFTTTTAISVVHVGSGPAMWVGNNGTGDIASFYDIDQNVEVLHVGGENSIDGPGVGIRTSFPNKALTVNGEISANNVIYDASGSSLNWNSVYSSVASTSANWDNTYTVTSTNSANWNLGYDGFTILNSNSANWNDTYTTVQSNSATTWNYQGEDLKALSGEWVGGNIAYTNLIANSAAYLSGVDVSFLSVSANWDNVYSSVASTSSNWDNTYTTTNSNSANWNLGYAGFTGLTALSSNWEATYTAVQSNSSNWDTVYSTVCALSTSWEESADILPTVTNYLSTNNVLLSSATITDNISARGSVAASQSIIPVTVTNLSVDRIFTDADTNKIFHFDTTTGALTASFPGALTDGFNAAIMNTGTNYLHISSNIQYNAVGNKLIDRYSGAYVYKSSSQIFAVGGV